MTLGFGHWVLVIGHFPLYWATRASRPLFLRTIFPQEHDR